MQKVKYNITGVQFRGINLRQWPRFTVEMASMSKYEHYGCCELTWYWRMQVAGSRCFLAAIWIHCPFLPHFQTESVMQLAKIAWFPTS
jgi:hypothetical protein